MMGLCLLVFPECDRERSNTQGWDLLSPVTSDKVFTSPPNIKEPIEKHFDNGKERQERDMLLVLP